MKLLKENMGIKFPDFLHMTPKAQRTKSNINKFSHFSLVTQSCSTLCGQATLSITNSQSSLRLTSIESVMPSSHLILCRPLLLLPSIFPSISVFSNESTLCMRWPKYWSFSFSISPSNDYPGLISFRMDWLDLFAVLSTEFKLSCLLCNHQFRT